MENKKDILFIGTYRQTDGWGLAAQDYVRALAKTGHNLSIKPIYLSPNIGHDIDHDLLIHEENQLDKTPDIVIQNMLPGFMDYIDGAKNIGLLFIETNHFEHMGWIQKLNLMDEVWVASHRESQSLLDCGIKVPVHIVPMPINTERFKNKSTKPLELPEIDDCFVFYFIGEYIARKNIDKLMLAFHREFRNNEPVKLILKVNKTNVSPQDLVSQIQDDFGIVKQKARLFANEVLYTQEFLIADRLNEEELLGLHQRCDCLVIPSSGESLNRPSMEAMAAGNPVIVTKNTGMADLGLCSMAAPEIYMIDSRESVVLVGDPAARNLYTSNETWFEPCVLSLQKAMRAAYINKSNSNINKEHIERYSYDSVAERMSEVL